MTRTWAFESLKNLPLNGLLLTKVYNVWTKKARGDILHDRGEWYKIWIGIDLLVNNWHEEFNKFWSKHSKFSEIYFLMSYFWPKYIMFELKKYRRVIFYYTGEWCKTWREIDLSLQNWHDEFSKFWLKHSKISNNFPLVGYFWPTYIMF